MKLTLVDNDESDFPHSEERPPKRQKTEDRGKAELVDAQTLQSQAVQSLDGNSMCTTGPGILLPAIDSGKPVHIDSEMLDTSNGDELLEGIRKLSSGGVQLAQSRKSCVKAPGSPATSAEDEQQKLDLDVQSLAERPAGTQTTEMNGGRVCQSSSRAPSPQPSRSLDREVSEKDRRLSQYSTHAETAPVAADRENKVERSPTESTKAGNGGTVTGSILPSDKPVSNDSAVSFPLCTSCGTKRVFNTPRNGETEILW